ncbi:MAG: hypothetical protein CMH21_08180 [Methylophaga sp.]|jgi:hypothetical protein|nr:hypothetical protein [Methylophaga sp.]MAY17693.1 hypothetical protein [Methylophaga sp.]MBN47004.1 hypothetical protein [Methylophaga sp.]HAO25806.1 hypothetical protein [Methylophaga sp.]HCD05495.1 hypothetical protein [Methylophaga sp.]|tara:strand:+ start:5608 stop:6312 length:705 start_codon:yes stop_codon:yes gene_type:complete
MTSPLDSYVIQPKRPWRLILWIVLSVIITGLIQWYWFNHDSGEKARLIEHNKHLTEQVAAMKNQLMQQSESQQNQQQVQAMHQATVQQLQNRLEQLQKKVIDLDKELLFYQNITQGNSTSELQIRDLQLRPEAENPEQLRYRLVITQGKNISEPITGEVMIKLQNSEGEGEEAKTIDLNVTEHPLNLRHVQVIEGVFNLSEISVPEQISVSLRQKDKVLISRNFDWQTDTPVGQ